MQPHVIVLNGPAGVGKTTVGRCHVERFLAAFDVPAPVFLFTLWAPLPTILERERSRTNREPLGERVVGCYHAIQQDLEQLGIIG